MNEEKKWYDDYVQWKALSIIISIAILVLGAIYSLASQAMEATVDNKNDVTRVETRQEEQYRAIQQTLTDIKKAIEKTH